MFVWSRLKVWWHKGTSSSGDLLFTRRLVIYGWSHSSSKDLFFCWHMLALNLHRGILCWKKCLLFGDCQTTRGFTTAQHLLCHDCAAGLKLCRSWSRRSWSPKKSSTDRPGTAGEEPMFLTSPSSEWQLHQTLRCEQKFYFRVVNGWNMSKCHEMSWNFWIRRVSRLGFTWLKDEGVFHVKVAQIAGQKKPEKQIGFSACQVLSRRVKSKLLTFCTLQAMHMDAYGPFWTNAWVLSRVHWGNSGVL